jgi:outer membrane lipoprotein SlyB
MKPRFLALTLTLVALAATLGGCSTTRGDVVQARDAQRLSTVQDAVVLNVRAVIVEGQQTGAGAVTGGVVGVSRAVRSEAGARARPSA